MAYDVSCQVKDVKSSQLTTARTGVSPQTHACGANASFERELKKSLRLLGNSEYFGLEKERNSEVGVYMAAEESIPRRILVVDDNVDGAESLAMLLELEGHTTKTAHNGAGALEAATAFKPQVVFLDIGLPDINGYEVARRIRKDPSLEGIVLVALTGWGADDDRQQAKDAGFDQHLTKPVEASAVDDVLRGLG